jgi:hypothetical protein
MRTLSRYGCVAGGNARADVELTAAQVNAIVTKLKELRPVCAATCSTDLTTARVAVGDCTGQLQGRYSGNEDQSCFGVPHTEPPPYLAISDLVWLRGAFDAVIRACDDGDAGVCGGACRKAR